MRSRALQHYMQNFGEQSIRGYLVPTGVPHIISLVISVTGLIFPQIGTFKNGDQGFQPQKDME